MPVTVTVTVTITVTVAWSSVVTVQQTAGVTATAQRHRRPRQAAAAHRDCQSRPVPVARRTPVSPGKPRAGRPVAWSRRGGLGTTRVILSYW
jgi:hypothetical protein